MPAKQKCLSTPGQRVLKVSAAILGSFILTTAIHLAIAVLVENQAPLIMTYAYSTFFVWTFFMVIAFLFDAAWKPWVYYLLGTAFCSLIIYFNL